VTLVADLGSAQAVDVVALCDHNLTAAGTISIAGHTVDSWGAPSLSESITYQAGDVLRYLTTASRTYRYWRLSLTDTANGDGYLRIGELFLGSYVAFSLGFAPEWNRKSIAATYGPTGPLRAGRGVWATAETIDLLFRGMTTTDRAVALALFIGLYDPDVGTVTPCIFNLDSADPADVSLYEFESPELSILPQRALPTPLYTWKLRLRQRPRIARSGT
jgi:hypothetical protein